MIEYFLPLRLRPFCGAVWYFEGLVWMTFPVMAVFLIHAAKIAGTYRTWLDLIGAVASAGTISGILAINVGHELVHRRERWQRALGVGLLSLVNYAHYGILHVFGHHKNVATVDDPATARFGENVYSFWWRHYTMKTPLVSGIPPAADQPFGLMEMDCGNRQPASRGHFADHKFRFIDCRLQSAPNKYCFTSTLLEVVVFF